MTGSIRAREIIRILVRTIEIFLAVAILFGVLIYLFNTGEFFISADWRDSAVFYDLIYEALLITIGLEFARMLVTHNYESILELFAFVIARKMLKPEITMDDIALGAFSFIGIILVSKYLHPHKKYDSGGDRIGNKS